MGGKAHATCNMMLRTSRDLPVACHNLRRYDAHLIIKELRQLCSEKGLTLECIPKGMEDYLSFSVRMKTDSAHGGSKRKQKQCSAGGKRRTIAGVFILDQADDEGEPEEESGVAKRSPFWKISWKSIRSSYRSGPATEKISKGQNIDMLLRKGIYPYEYMDCVDKFDDTQLPPIEAFHSSLTDEGVSEEDNEWAQKVWKEFAIKNMGEYHDLYLRTDVLLLADVFESFRTLRLKHYRIDPAHYYTVPGFAWDSFLRMTGVRLELLQDVEMYTYCEEEIRGGVAMISNRYSKANNPYIVTTEGTSGPTKYIIYLDANNLFGYAMVQLLPKGGFAWVTQPSLMLKDFE